ncbi:hypothetical protein C1646_716748, partial [Rhizophagus diaphanus]
MTLNYSEVNIYCIYPLVIIFYFIGSLMKGNDIIFIHWEITFIIDHYFIGLGMFIEIGTG